MGIKTLIVERDDTARRKLATVVDLEDDFEVIGAHCNLWSAAALLEESAPDVLFLDCGLSLSDCCDALSCPPSNQTTGCVLLGTATSFSVAHLSLPTLDYLQRPIKLAHLAAALDRIRRWTEARLPIESPNAAAQILDGERLMLQRGRNLVFVPLADIEFIKASLNYLKIQATAESYRFRETIGHLLARLPPHFVRIHRSYIANSRCIVEFLADGQGGHLLALRSGRTLPVGPTHAARLREWLRSRPRAAFVAARFPHEQRERYNSIA